MDFKNNCKTTRKGGRRGALLASLTLIAGIIAGLSPAAFAIGTPAGTAINNRASATFQSGGASVNVDSNLLTHTVDEVIDVVVTVQTSPVVTASPASDQAIRFLVTNTGNGIETFSLTVDDALAGEDFDPTFTAIYIDDGDGVFEPGTDDVLHSAGANDPVLNANVPASASVEVWVVVSIPGAEADGNNGDIELIAASTNPGAAGSAPGTTLAGQGDGGTDAVVGNTNADGADQGRYTISSVAVAIVKSATVLDPFGNATVIPGAVITYTLVVDVTGTGVATGLVISDPIPADTLYDPGSITLDAAPRGDANTDGDGADFNGTTANAITVDLGDVTAPASHTITFRTILQ